MVLSGDPSLSPFREIGVPVHCDPLCLDSLSPPSCEAGSDPNPPSMSFTCGAWVGGLPARDSGAGTAPRPVSDIGCCVCLCGCPHAPGPSQRRPPPSLPPAPHRCPAPTRLPHTHTTSSQLRQVSPQGLTGLRPFYLIEKTKQSETKGYFDSGRNKGINLERGVYPTEKTENAGNH